MNLIDCPFDLALVIKPSNIRIWIHDKDIDKLMRVVLEGHGNKLRNEVANQPRVKRFLENVPHFLGLIKSIHQSVVENNIELLQSKTQPPIPPQFLSCKDANGLNPLHKAAGLAHTKIVEYILSVWPNAAHELDAEGKSPLHYAASVKNNDRAFNLLVQAGADELLCDRVSQLISTIRTAIIQILSTERPLASLLQEGKDQRRPRSIILDGHPRGSAHCRARLSPTL